MQLDLLIADITMSCPTCIKPMLAAAFLFRFFNNHTAITILIQRLCQINTVDPDIHFLRQRRIKFDSSIGYFIILRRIVVHRIFWVVTFCYVKATKFKFAINHWMKEGRKGRRHHITAFDMSIWVQMPWMETSDDVGMRKLPVGWKSSAQTLYRSARK